MTIVVSKSSTNPEVFVSVTCLMVVSAFFVVHCLQTIHKVVAEHHVDGPVKVRCGLIGSYSRRQSILAQSVTEIEMVCNGNMTKKLGLGEAPRNSHVSSELTNLICCQLVQHDQGIIWWFPFHRSCDMKRFSICRASLVWVDFLQNDDETFVLLHMTSNDIRYNFDFPLSLYRFYGNRDLFPWYSVIILIMQHRHDENRMEWRYNDISKTKMTINEKCNVSIDEIKDCSRLCNNKTDLPCTSSSFSSCTIAIARME